MPPDDHRPALQPPQFNLRAMLVGVALLCGLLAASTVLGGYGIFAVVLFALSIFAHLAGSALGMRLRSNGDRRLTSDEALPPYRMRYAPPDPNECAPVTRLGRRDSLGSGIIVLTVLGMLAGGALGWLAMQHLYQQADWLNLAAGAVAFAVLAGICSFLGVGFLQVLLAALWQASREAKRR